VVQTSEDRLGHDVSLSLVADAHSPAHLTARWPAGIEGPVTFWTHVRMADPDAAHGFRAFNGPGGLRHRAGPSAPRGAQAPGAAFVRAARYKG
jgi:hypothetical protein